jgi:hypothetical protein
MDTAKFYRLMEDVSLLNNETLPELKQLVDDYPYFQTARMLYLKNLAILNDEQFGLELKKTAVYVPDRRMLYILIEEIRLIIEEFAGEQTPPATDPFELIEQFLHENSKNEPAPELVLRQPLSGEYFSLNFDDKEPIEKSGAPPLRHGNLIDDFLKEEERSTKHPWKDMDDDIEYATPESIEWLQNGKDPKSLSDSYFTETLARIFIKQKRYEKALEIIRNLSLNYPEKNVYFADQIRFLEKLIINIKKYN